MLKVGIVKNINFRFWIIFHAISWLYGHAGCIMDQCDREDALCKASEGPRLVIRSPMEVGHAEELHIKQGESITVKTVSVHPPVFEIDNFLTDGECEHLKQLAVSLGLEESSTYRNSPKSRQVITVPDIDGNKLLNIDEMRLLVENSFDVYLGEEDTVQMYKDLVIDKNEDGLVDPGELSELNLDDLTNWLDQYIAKYPATKSRISQQIWLYADRKNDPIIYNIQNKAIRLTGLLPELIETADLQVVHYSTGGHYHAHYDSSDHSDNIPCCRQTSKYTPTPKDNCRICRFMTILFYLNDVEEGGGTAFPVADNNTFHMNEMRVKHLINLREHCHDANLIVTPSRGKAVMWYNHLVEEEGGWTGTMDPQSIHGGCPVSKGEKWIANFWVKTSDDKQADLEMLGL